MRVAERFGRGDREGVADASRLGLAAAIVVGTALGLAVWATSGTLARVSLAAEGEGLEPGLGDGARLAPLLARLLAAAALVTLFDGLQGVASMALRAREVVWAPTAIHVGSYAAVMVPLCWWLALFQSTRAVADMARLSSGLDTSAIRPEIMMPWDVNSLTVRSNS